MDVFEEINDDNYINIELPMIPNGSRRFSFSIPEPIENKQPLAPPPSPEILPFERPAILIPDDDFYFELCHEDSLSPTYKSLPDIQTTLDFPKDELFISTITDKTTYKQPPKKSHDALKIWKAAYIPKLANIRQIEIALLDWAYNYAHLEIKDKKILSITWISDSQCTCRAKWSSFLRWMICACYSI
jgi:hypothetical protein